MRTDLVATFEVPEKAWAFEEWRCSEGGDCCSIEPAHLGHWLGETHDGREVDVRGCPFIVLFADGTCRMVCEDCCVGYEEERRDAAIAPHERNMNDI